MSNPSIHTAFTFPSVAAIRAAWAICARSFRNHLIHIYMKSLRQLSLTAACICAFVSCSMGLSREEAARLITAHYGFPYVEVERVTHSLQPSEHLVPTRGLNLFGGIQVGQTSDMFYYQAPPYDGMKATFWPTELGNSYLAPYPACDACIQPLPDFAMTKYRCFATNIWELKEVTGISQEGKTATVEYVAIATHVNTVGMYNKLREGLEETRKVTLRQFDDNSWRIENEKPKYIVKPNEIPKWKEEYAK